MARQRVPEGPPPPPPVQRLRLRYAKRGRLRFTSTRDFQRSLERALRRAEVPMAFSAGFHPHPRISYANAAATGAASEAEYVEIALIRRVDPQGVRAALNAALPDGLDILDVVEAGPGSLADRLEASVWELTFAAAESARLRAACEVFRAAESCEVSRMTKSGLRVFDARAAVLAMEVREALSDGCVILRLVVRHTTPAVRPDDVLNALDRCATFVPAARPLVTRLAQGPLVGTTGVADPLVSDGNVTGP